ncbi:Derlin-1.2 [Dictyocoela muelleri]|nr:Derlin-1.2 [Dictyocoela muelleri]
MTENLILEIYKQTPPVTRIYSTILIITSLLIYINPDIAMYLSYSTYHLKKLQLWRILTCFFYFGPMTFDNILHILFFCRYSKYLEEGFVNSKEYLNMMIIVSTILFIIANFLNLSVLGPSLASTITYIWTKRNSTAQVIIFGCIVFPAFYMPFIFPIMNLISDNRIPVDEILGIIVGHTYYFFKFIAPRFKLSFSEIRAALRSDTRLRINNSEKVNIGNKEGDLNAKKSIDNKRINKNDNNKNNNNNNDFNCFNKTDNNKNDNCFNKNDFNKNDFNNIKNDNIKNNNNDNCFKNNKNDNIKNNNDICFKNDFNNISESNHEDEKQSKDLSLENDDDEFSNENEWGNFDEDGFYDDFNEGDHLSDESYINNVNSESPGDDFEINMNFGKNSDDESEDEDEWGWR